MPLLPVVVWEGGCPDAKKTNDDAGGPEPALRSLARAPPARQSDTENTRYPDQPDERDVMSGGVSRLNMRGFGLNKREAPTGIEPV